jgi:RNA polymerase sigma factor (sigma-70 family)
MSTLIEETFTALYQEHAKLVCRMAAERLRPGDLDQADDIAQETFIRLWRNLVAGVVVERPTALLRTITRRVVIDHYRARDRRREDSADFTDYGAALRLPASAPAEDIAVMQMAARTQLRHTSPSCRTHARARTERLMALAVAA